MSEAITKAIQHLPEVDDEELLHVASLMKGMGEEQARQFAAVYKKRRKDATVTLLLAVVGFLGVGGVHRFYLDQIGMGLLYLLTGGLCLVGTIVDMFNHSNLTLEYNKKRAEDAAVMIRMAIDDDLPPRSLPPSQ